MAAERGRGFLLLFTAALAVNAGFDAAGAVLSAIDVLVLGVVPAGAGIPRALVRPGRWSGSTGAARDSEESRT